MAIRSEPRPAHEADIPLPSGFSTVRRGYDPAEVDAAVGKLTERIQTLETQLQAERTRVHLLERRAAAAGEEAYSRLLRHLTEVVRAADEAGSRLRAHAESEAAGVVAAARKEAEEIVQAARAEAERMARGARRAADEDTGERWRSVFGPGGGAQPPAGRRTAPPAVGTDMGVDDFELDLDLGGILDDPLPGE